MRELHETEEAPQKAFLIGIRDGSMEDWEAESLTKELGSLAKTLGLNIVGYETVRIRGKNAQYGMGTGKADEITEAAKALDADCLVFDQDISPSQQRNWEELTGIPAIDRQEVIIQIFANRAKTREAELQIELAQLTHSLPRLTHKYIDLSRQRGGRYGTKGSGETKLELDRRTVQRRIHQLQEELLEVRKQRATQRKRRERVPIPSCALVGYTNAGKSSLLNGMTKAQVLVEDKLFATLDATTRRVEISKGQPILLTDTVGFIRRLPHELVDAFHSTLEEVTLADLLVQVLDASDPELDRHFDVTMTVIKELGAEKTPMILVLNKIDRIESPEGLDTLRHRYSDGVFVSALTGQGLDDLARRLDLRLSGPLYRFQFPPNRHDLVALLHRSGTVISEKYTDTHIDIEARVGERLLGTLKEWLQEPPLGSF
jgi:GTP-binding protein HflX